MKPICFLVLLHALHFCISHIFTLLLDAHVHVVTCESEGAFDQRKFSNRVSGVLETSQLHLGLQGARRELAPIARVLEVAALPEGVVDVPEGHEGAQELGEGPRHGDVVGGRAGGDAGDLRVHGRIGEHQAPAAEKDLLVGLVEGRVQGHLARQHADVFDRVVRGAAAGAQGVRGLGELQLQDQVQLGRQELPGLKHADERGRRSASGRRLLERAARRRCPCLRPSRRPSPACARPR